MRMAAEVGSRSQRLIADGWSTSFLRDRALDLSVPLKAFFKQGLPHPLMILPVIKYWHNNDAGILSWAFSGISVACLFVCFLVHAVALRCKPVPLLGCNLAYLSVFLRIVAATLLLLFLDPVHHRVAILPLSVLVIGLLAYFRKTFILDNRRPAAKILYWGKHKDELTLRFDLSSQVVTFAYAGLIGTVFGYVKKGSSNQQLLSGGSGYMAPDCFLSYSILLGRLVQLFSTVPSFVFHTENRGPMVKVCLRIVAYASLMFLVLGGVMAAEEILRERIFISCFIIVVIPVLCFWYEIARGPRYGRDPRRGDDEKYVLAYFTASFAALMASHSVYGTETGGIPVSLSRWFKFSVLSVLHGVLSYAARMVFLSEVPQIRSSALWTWSMFATVPITFFLVASVYYMHPDEIKHII